ncbi:MAG: YfhO family protein [Bacilli bacterium]|jgi:hypothetical protein|nr:YfhO family protein [Bacilli bacterium]
MKKILKNKIVNETLIFMIILLLLLVLLNLSNYIFGRVGGDFLDQHIRFIDYIRESYLKTGQLFPQIVFNYGGSINAATMFYHGFTNPYIMILVFLKIPTMMIIQINLYFTIVLTFLSFRILASKFINSDLIGLSLSILISFSPVLTYHITVHTMFLYVIPYFVLSLLSIYNIVNKDRYGLLIFTCTMIMFINFFYMVVTGFIQVFFLFLLSKQQHYLSNKEMFKKYGKLFICYVIVILLSMIAIYPQLQIILSGGRSDMVLGLKIYHKQWILETVLYASHLGLGIISIFTIILCLFNYKNKLLLYLGLFIMISFICEPLNLLYNAFLYVDPKVWMAFLPIIMLTFGIALEQNTYQRINIPIIISIIIISSTLFNLREIADYLRGGVGTRSVPTQFIFIGIFILLQIIFIKLINNNMKIKKKTSFVLLLCLLISIMAILNNTYFISKDRFNKFILRDRDRSGHVISKYEANGLYREALSTNFAKGINSYNPLVYTSLVNNNYISFYTDYLNVERNQFGNRLVNITILKNSLLRSIIGIDDENIDTRPVIYGVLDEDITKADINKISKQDRIFKFSSEFMINDNKYPEIKNKIVPHLIKEIPFKDFKINYKKNKKHKNKIPKGKIYEMKIPQQYLGKGMFYITGQVLNKDIGRTLIVANNDNTYVRAVNHYGEKEIREFDLLLDLNKEVPLLRIFVNNDLNQYSNFKIHYISYDDINKALFNYIEPTAVKVNYNKNYNFTLNLAQNGYLGTSIFYDKGFIIKDNGKVINKEKVNGFFLGAKLKKGQHKLSIDYEMPGLKQGVILSLSGFGLLVGTFMIRIITRKKIIKSA